MNPSDFIRKWRDVALTERSACHEHFYDLCGLVEHLTPVALDKTGDFFTFEKGAAKEGGGQGWADVWKKGFFGWEYKGPHADLNKAYAQLLRYREALENPPLLVVCDMNIIEVHTNFTSTASVTYTIPLEEIEGPRNLEVLRAVFHDPEKLKPGRTSEAITTEAARRIGEIAQRLRERGEEAHAVAHFLDRIVFCMFAEDIGLLQEDIFSRILDKTRRDPDRFQKTVAQLFDAMASGGDFGMDTVKRFNGSLFHPGPILALDEKNLQALHEASRLDWSAVDPSIFGTLFVRGLDPSMRAQLGAQFTSRADIEVLVDAVILAPLRREWEKARTEAESWLAKSEALDEEGKGKYTLPTVLKNRERAFQVVADFLGRLGSIRILDPACGSGNFLFVTLQKLLDLEKEVINWAADRGLAPSPPLVHPRQFLGIEVNPYAHDLAQMTLWIGYLQWIHANGLGTHSDPILETLAGNFLNMDAILDLTDPNNPRDPEWPAADFIVGNPPFLGDKMMRKQLGDGYVASLRLFYKGRIPGKSDLCCYWFEKARASIQFKKCHRAGLLATQAIRQATNRKILERIKQTGDIFFGESDRPWILDGANVHVSMVGFDDGSERNRTLDSCSVSSINTNLTATDKSPINARPLNSNQGLAAIGTTKKGPLDVQETIARLWLNLPNPHGKPNSDVLRPLMNTEDITSRKSTRWVIDFKMLLECDAALYEEPFAYLRKMVFPIRVNHREKVQRDYWWRLARPCPELQDSLAKLGRFLVTPTTSKHRVFVWLSPAILPDHKLVAFSTEDDYQLGILQSRIHESWALAVGSQLRERESGFTYTPTTCFETFPFPWPPGKEPQEDTKVKAIAEAAAELDRLRRNWLNPPEWVKEEILEFPGTVGGPWAKFVVDPNPQGVGTVRYPRLVPKDEGCASQLKKRTLTNLYNQRPAWLDLAHRRLDEAVATAYGWPPDLTDEQILERLLTLNLERVNG